MAAYLKHNTEVAIKAWQQVPEKVIGFESLYFRVLYHYETLQNTSHCGWNDWLRRKATSHCHDRKSKKGFIACDCLSFTTFILLNIFSCYQSHLYLRNFSSCHANFEARHNQSAIRPNNPYASIVPASYHSILKTQFLALAGCTSATGLNFNKLNLNISGANAITTLDTAYRSIFTRPINIS